MANQKISELTALLGSNVADDDALAIVDTSTTETKKIAFSQLKLALDTSTGFVRITGDTMTGNLTVPNLVTAGNVDGRDVSADGSKLDGIEASADVTDTANVTAAGALMDSEVTNLAQVKAFDSSDYATAAQGATADAAMPKAGGTFTGDALFSDNVKATFGAGSDLQIYHDGSNSYVDDTGDGALILRGNNNVTIGKYTGETMGYFEADGAAYLYHNNAIKFQTSSIGSQTDQLFGISDADTGIALGANGADIMQFYTGNNERARLTDGGDLLVAKSSGGLANVGHELDAEGYAYHTRDGGVPLYVNRKTNDGNFVQFYKDQANIGSVGNNGTNFIFKGEHSSGVVQLQSHNGNEDIEVGDGKIVFEAGGSERMRLNSTGLGVGTNSPDALAHIYSGASGVTNPHSYTKLHVESASHSAIQLSGSTSSEQWIWFADDTSSTPVGGITYYHGSNYMGFQTNGAERMRLTSGGDLHVDGNVIAYSTTISDERLKEDIKPIEGALDKVGQLSGYTFTYKADGKQSAGVIAQEVEKVFPSAVSESTLPLKTDDGVEYKTVEYDQLVGLLIESVKELKAEIEELKNGSAK